jgi:FtsH-binding integral membrane protein
MDLMTKTFLIIGGMLIVTTIAARFNKALETKTEATIAIVGSFLTLFICFILADQYPINLWACAAFSGFTGWILGPAVGNIGYAVKFGKFSESKGVKVKEVSNEPESFKDRITGANALKHVEFYFDTDDEEIHYFKSDSSEMLALREEFDATILAHGPYCQEWQNLLLQATLATCVAVLSTAAIVAFSSTDYGFLGPFLFIALIALVICELFNAFLFKTKRTRQLKTYAGIVIFTLYLIFDFNILEKRIANGDESWGTAVQIAVNIYLDIINLFLYILRALAESN